MTTANLSVDDNEAVIQYTSTGETAFTFPFPILAASELRVSVDQVDKTNGTDYTVSGVGDEGGGTVTFTAATTAGEVITIWLDMEIKRLTGFSAGASTILPSALNDELARAVRVEQMLRRDIGRSLRLAPDDPQSGQDMEIPTQTTRAGKFLAFNASGAPIVSEGSGGGDTSLRSDLADSADQTKGFNLVAIPKSDAESAAGVTVVQDHIHLGNALRYGPNTTPGTTDMTAAIQAAMDVGPIVYLPGDDDYFCADDLLHTGSLVLLGDGARIVFATGKNLHITGSVDAGVTPGANIAAGDRSITLATSCVKGDILWIEGDDSTTPAANLTLSTNTIRAAVTVTASASVFVAGDVGKNILTDSDTASLYITGFNSGTEVTGYISNNNVPSTTSYTSGNWTLRTNFCPSRPYYERGEMLRVVSYATGAATVETPAIEAYTAADTTVYKITPAKVEIKGVRVSGSKGSDGILKLTYCSDSIAEKVTTANAGSTGMGLLLTKCFDIETNHCITDAHYGLMWQGCQDCRAIGGHHATDSGHSVEVSSGTNTPPSRRISISNLTAKAEDDLFAINTHGGVSEVFVSDCVAYGGIGLYGQNCAVRQSNVVSAVAGRDAVRLFPEVSGEYMEASDITVNGLGVGVAYKENYAAVGAKAVIIERIRGTAETGVQLTVVSDYNAVPFETRELSIAGCNVEASSGNCVVFDAGSKTSSSDADRIRRVSIANNPKLLSGTNRSLFFRGNSAVVSLDLRGNGLVCGQGDNGWDIDGVINVTCHGNRSAGTGTGGSSNVIGSSVTGATVTHNTFDNFVTSRGLTISLATPRNGLVADNEHIDCSGTAPDLDDYAIRRVNTGQNVEIRAAAVPAAGAWVRGDVCWFTAPSASAAPGAICTASGSPGTWKDMANLAA